MDDYNLKRIADALEEVAKELKFRRELNQDTNMLNSKIEGLAEEINSIKQHIENLK